MESDDTGLRQLPVPLPSLPEPAGQGSLRLRPPPSSAELPCRWREVRLLAAQPPASSFRPWKDGTDRRVGLTTRPLQND